MFELDDIATSAWGFEQKGESPLKGKKAPMALMSIEVNKKVNQNGSRLAPRIERTKKKKGE